MELLGAAVRSEEAPVSRALRLSSIDSAWLSGQYLRSRIHTARGQNALTLTLLSTQTSPTPSHPGLTRRAETDEGMVVAASDSQNNTSPNAAELPGFLSP